MIKVALRGLAGRKLRAVLTAIAIVLGVAMISGTYILTDTIDRAFKTLFTESYAGTDAVVTGKGLDISIDGESAAEPARRRFAARDGARRRRGRARVRDGARRAQHEDPEPRGRGGQLRGRADLRVRHRHRPRPRAVQPAEHPRGAVACRGERGRDRRGDRGRRTDTTVGDTVEITTLQPKRPFELVGVARYGSVDSLGDASFAVFTIPAAQELLEREGQYDAISAAATEGVTEDELVGAIAPVLPDSAKVVSATAEAAGGGRRDQRVHGDLPLLPRSSSPASRSSSARSSSSTPSRSPSPSARASSRRCGRSAPRGGRSSAR